MIRTKDDTFDVEIQMKGRDRLQVLGYMGVKFLSETHMWKQRPSRSLAAAPHAPPKSQLLDTSLAARGSIDPGAFHAARLFGALSGSCDAADEVDAALGNDVALLIEASPCDSCRPGSRCRPGRQGSLADTARSSSLPCRRRADAR